MKRPGVRHRIREISLQLLAEHPGGLRYSELLRYIPRVDRALNANTVNATIHSLDTDLAGLIYKPSKGLYRLLQYRDDAAIEQSSTSSTDQTTKVKEEDFYIPFANWLTNDVEDVTHAISLGGSTFRDKWGTPDVIGTRESKRSDVIKASTSIVSAEIKADSQQIVTAFGQACAYRLFSHKSYLAVPRQTGVDELARLDSLCEISGIGLVVFDATNPLVPDFKILVRATKNEPDLYYTNKYIAHIERRLFL